MRQSFTTTVHVEGKDWEIEIDYNLNPAEYDVGIMGNWIDEWEVTCVESNTSSEACREMEASIEKEYGDVKFLDKLYAEGAAEYDDYYD